jgi:hypothetical protein
VVGRMTMQAYVFFPRRELVGQIRTVLSVESLPESGDGAASQ